MIPQAQQAKALHDVHRKLLMCDMSEMTTMNLGLHQQLIAATHLLHQPKDCCQITAGALYVPSTLDCSCHACLLEQGHGC